MHASFSRRNRRVMSAPLRLQSVAVQLRTPAVKFDFMKPLGTDRRDLRQRRRHRANEGYFRQHRANLVPSLVDTSIRTADALPAAKFVPQKGISSSNLGRVGS